jgi:hypothetical protein
MTELITRLWHRPYWESDSGYQIHESSIRDACVLYYPDGSFSFHLFAFMARRAARRHAEGREA